MLQLRLLLLLVALVRSDISIPTHLNAFYIACVCFLLEAVFSCLAAFPTFRSSCYTACISYLSSVVGQVENLLQICQAASSPLDIIVSRCHLLLIYMALDHPYSGNLEHVWKGF